MSLSTAVEPRRMRCPVSRPFSADHSASTPRRLSTSPGNSSSGRAAFGTLLLQDVAVIPAIAILDLGELVASGSPAELSDNIDAQVVVVASKTPRKVSKFLEQQAFVHSTAQIGNTMRVMVDSDLENPAGFTRSVLSDGGLSLDGCEKVRPNLEDVFVAATQARKARRGKMT